MSNATEAHRLAVREMLAKAMGWKYREVTSHSKSTYPRWKSPGEDYERTYLPFDPYTSPADCMALMEWFCLLPGTANFTINRLIGERRYCRIYSSHGGKVAVDRTTDIFLHDHGNNFMPFLTEAIAAALGGVE